jgi:hypothetical protein
VKEDGVTDRRRRYEAVTVADVSTEERTQRVRLFVVEHATGRTREIRGLPFAWRPFSDLAWVDDRTLVFDRWSSPHAGMHYAVDAAGGTLVAAVPFHDRAR